MQDQRRLGVAKTQKNVVMVSNDKPYVDSLALALSGINVIYFCKDSVAAIDKYFKRFDHKRCHAIIIDFDPSDSSVSNQENGASLVKYLRFEIGIDTPIIVLCFKDLNTPQYQSKHTILKRRGHYFLRQPFLLPELKKPLLDGEKCDLPYEIKCSRIKQYGVFVKHEFIDKLDWRLRYPEEIRRLWNDTRNKYYELGGFDTEIGVVDKSLRAMDKMQIVLGVKSLLRRGRIILSVNKRKDGERLCEE